MKKSFLAALLAFASVPALAGTPPPKEINDAYASEINAYIAMDAKGALATLADGYTYKDAAGKVVNRAQYAKSIKDMFASAKSIKVTASFLTTTKLSADMVKQGFDVRLSVKLKSGGTSDMHEVGVDTWKKIGGKWMETKTVDTTTDEIIHK